MNSYPGNDVRLIWTFRPIRACSTTIPHSTQCPVSPLWRIRSLRTSSLLHTEVSLPTSLLTNLLLYLFRRHNRCQSNESKKVRKSWKKLSLKSNNGKSIRPRFADTGWRTNRVSWARCAPLLTEFTRGATSTIQCLLTSLVVRMWALCCLIIKLRSARTMKKQVSVNSVKNAATLTVRMNWEP